MAHLSKNASLLYPFVEPLQQTLKAFIITSYHTSQLASASLLLTHNPSVAHYMELILSLPILVSPSHPVNYQSLPIQDEPGEGIDF